MKQVRLTLTALILVFTAVVGLQGFAFGQAQGPPEFVPGEVLVKFKPEATANIITTLKTQHGLETIKVFRRTRIYHLRILSRLSVQEVIARLRQSVGLHEKNIEALRKELAGIR